MILYHNTGCWLGYVMDLVELRGTDQPKLQIDKFLPKVGLEHTESDCLPTRPLGHPTEILKRVLNFYYIITYELNQHVIHNCAKLIVNRGVLELSVRQNMYFFYQYRYYLILLLYLELCTNSSIHNHFDT